MKYEFVPGDEKVVAPGRTVKRIRAIVAIAAFDVAAGEVGGYVESEKNLHQYGNAWVSGDAWVSGNALVSGDARVYVNARVYGDARVSGNARVSGDAQVYGNGMIFWATKVGRDNATLTVFNGKDGLIVTRGCFIGSIDDFLSKSEKEHDDATHIEYRMLIEVAYSRITRALEAK